VLTLGRDSAASLLAWLIVIVPAPAAEKPAVSPDQPVAFATQSRISAILEFNLSTLAAEIQRDFPRRLATIDERVNCVRRRVLLVKINANCDIRGYVERTSPVSLYGKGDHVLGSVAIFGTVGGQGANRITSHIRGEAQARATVEAEARPELRRDWSLELNFADGFHWNEAPYLHVLGRDIPLARYVEPRIRAQLAHVRTRALAAARALDLHGKAQDAWQQAFEPIKLTDDPEMWLQLKPQDAAFAGVRIDTKLLRGFLQISGDAETFIGRMPPPATPSPLAPLGTAVSAPGTFDIILPVDIDYDTLRQSIMKVIAATPEGRTTIRDVQIYPSSGKIVFALRVGKTSESDPSADEWVYLSATPQVDADRQTCKFSDLAAADDLGQMFGNDQLLVRLRQQVDVSYRAAYQKLIGAANHSLTRPLKNGFRMEGHIASASLDRVLLLSDGMTIALRVTGELKMLYGL
jgi:hypothetical protein